MENYIKIKYDIEQLMERECEKLKAKAEVVIEMADNGGVGDEQAVVL